MLVVSIVSILVCYYPGQASPPSLLPFLPHHNSHSSPHQGPAPVFLPMQGA